MRCIKKIKLICIFVLLISANAFASIVNSDDGSAFVTKKEFDTLKKNYAQSIANYNESIDNKITGAIAQYIAGMTSNYAPIEYYEKVKVAVGGDLWFKNNVEDIGSSSINSQTVVNLLRRYNYQYYNNLVTAWKTRAYNDTTNSNRVALTENSIKASGVTDTDYNNMLITYGYKIHSYTDPGEMAFDVPSSTYGFPTHYTTNEIAMPSGTSGNGRYQYLAMNHAKNPLTKGKRLISQMKNVTNEGSGSAFIYHTQTSGELNIREFATNLFPVQQIDIDAYTYKDFTKDVQTDLTAGEIIDWYGTEGGFEDTTDIAVDITIVNQYTSFSYGEKADTTSTDPLKVYYNYSLSQMKATDHIDYSVLQWGYGTDTQIYCCEDKQQPEYGSRTIIDASETASTFKSLVLRPSYTDASDNDLSGVELSYYPNTYTPSEKHLYDFSNQYLTAVNGDRVKIGGGTPILGIENKSQVVTLTLTFKSRDGEGQPYQDDIIHYKFSDMQFDKGDFVAGSQNYKSGTVTGSGSVSFTVTGLKGKIWMNIYSDKPGNEVAIDTLNYTIN